MLTDPPRLTIPREHRRQVENPARDSLSRDAVLRWRLVMDAYRAGKFDL